MLSWISDLLGVGKAVAVGLLVLVIIAALGALASGASAVKDAYDDGVTENRRLVDELAHHKAAQAAAIAQADERLRAVRDADRQREEAQLRVTEMQRRLEERVRANVLLHKKIRELEALRDQQVPAPEELKTPTLDGGERVVSADAPLVDEPVDLADFEFDGALRVFHDEALAACGADAGTLTLAAAGRSDQAPVTVGEFIETVVRNYCIAGQTKAQLVRAQHWGSVNCVR